MCVCPHCNGELDLFELLNEEMARRKAACNHMSVKPSVTCLYCVDCEDCGLHITPDEMNCDVH